jgi:D-glycero-D-manno-heptose 1,7-bisphosphate phosphatase
MWEEFKFIPGSIEGIRKLNQAGFTIFVVSNQTGVAKGLYTAGELERINKEMLKQLKKEGAYISASYYCTHLSSDNCDCKKPKPGLMEEAVCKLCEKPIMSFFIGDTFVDMKAAQNFGAKTILLLSGKEKIVNRNSWEFEPDYVFDNLFLAAHYICSHYG